MSALRARGVAPWLVAVLVGTAFACGGDSSDASRPSPTTEPTTTLAGAEPESAEPEPVDALPDAVDPGDAQRVEPARGEPEAALPEPGVVEGVGTIDLGDGVMFDVSLVIGGEPFDPDLDLAFATVFTFEGLDDDPTLNVNYELDLRTSTTNGSSRELMRRDDADGRHRAIVHTLVGVQELGLYTLTFEGSVSDGTRRASFERTVRFVATEEALVSASELEIAGGAISVEVPRRWRAVETALSFSTITETDTPEQPLVITANATEELLALAGRDGRFVRVSRSLQPLFLDDLDALVAALPELLEPGEFSDAVPIELGGLTGQRVVRTAPDRTETIDVLVTDDEVFVVQAAHGDDPEHAAETTAARDSLRFRPDGFDRLTHRIVRSLWLTVDGEPYFRIDTAVPANWRTDPDTPALTEDPLSGRLVVRQSFTADGESLDDFVADVIDQSVPDGAEATFEIDEVAGLERARIEVVGDPRGDAVSVIFTDGAGFEVTTVRDDPEIPDPDLISRIAATIRPVGPPSTN